MDAPHLTELLQSCVSPMLLVSGVGLILMTLANRLHHAIDRVRLLDHELDALPVDRCADKLVQLRLLFHRCRILQRAVACVVLSILSSALLVLCLFGLHFFALPLQPAVVLFFAVSLLTLAVSVVLTLIDVSKNLEALRVEVRGHL